MNVCCFPEMLYSLEIASSSSLIISLHIYHRHASGWNHVTVCPFYGRSLCENTAVLYLTVTASATKHHGSHCVLLAQLKQILLSYDCQKQLTVDKVQCKTRCSLLMHALEKKNDGTSMLVAVLRCWSCCGKTPVSSLVLVAMETFVLAMVVGLRNGFFFQSHSELPVLTCRNEQLQMTVTDQ